MAQKIFTISNILSFSRILLLFPIIYFLRYYPLPTGRFWAVGLMVLAGLTDFFDGMVARQLHQVTEFGKIIDPLADKIAVGAAVIVLVFLGDLPLWYVAAVLARDLIIFLGGLYIAKTKKLVVQSNWTGKIAVSLIALTIVFSALRNYQFRLITEILLLGSVVIMALSLVFYAKRFYEIVFAQPEIAK